MAEPTPPSEPVVIFGADDHLKARILSQIEAVRFTRSGVLEGQYMVLADGLLAIDRHGAPIKIITDSDNDWSHNSTFSQIENLCSSIDFIGQRDLALSQWDTTPMVSGAAFLGESYASSNYYHFLMLFLPKVRRFPDAESTLIAMPESYLRLAFQRELIVATYGARQIVPTPNMTRIENPTLLCESLSADSLTWLQSHVPHRARRGERLIYVTRTSTLVGRRHGGLVETDDFKAFLERHGFETIDFGRGDIPVSRQIEMLDGARVVLSVHGANLTNIAFLEEGVGVVEIMPYYWAYFSHLQIALGASLKWFGLVCHDTDENNQLIPPPALLEEALAAALDATAAPARRSRRTGQRQAQKSKLS